MLAPIVSALGGLGLFLFGMSHFTDGLRRLTGERLRRWLRRATRSPASGVVTGAVTTAVIQSSTASTVAAVGFAAAGVLTFPQALGIVLGANVGTTITGWMVTLLGLKLEVASGALLLVLLGSLVRLVRPRWAPIGLLVAGFGVAFFGLGLMRAGLTGLEGVVTPASFPGDTWGGRAALVGLGLVLTLITQSSSAGVAAALAALTTGTITFPQAAALIVGMDVGTTATAALATIGAPIAAKRTGMAHVVFNLLTGAAAYSMLVPYARIVEAWWPGATVAEPQICLVAFHTFFNLLGVALALPFVGPFARAIERLVPDRGERIALDRAWLRDPAVAVDGVIAASRRLAVELVGSLHELLASGQTLGGLREARTDIERMGAFLQEIRGPERVGTVQQRFVDALHLLDHLDRLVARLEGASSHRLRAPELDVERSTLRHDAARFLADGDHFEGAPERGDHPLAEDGEAFRTNVLERAARGEIGTTDAIELLDAYRWLRRVRGHLRRIAHHLRVALDGAKSVARPRPISDPAPPPRARRARVRWRRARRSRGSSAIRRDR